MNFKKINTEEEFRVKLFSKPLKVISKIYGGFLDDKEEEFVDYEITPKKTNGENFLCRYDKYKDIFTRKPFNDRKTIEFILNKHFIPYKIIDNKLIIKGVYVDWNNGKIFKYNII